MSEQILLDVPNSLVCDEDFNSIILLDSPISTKETYIKNIIESLNGKYSRIKIEDKNIPFVLKYYDTKSNCSVDSAKFCRIKYSIRTNNTSKSVVAEFFKSYKNPPSIHMLLEDIIQGIRKNYYKHKELFDTFQEFYIGIFLKVPK